MSDQDPVGDMIIERFGRSTLPVRHVGGSVGTAFLFNELVDSTPDADRVREWLVTADALTWSDLGEFRLRPEMITPVGAASDLLIVRDFRNGWWTNKSRVAVMRSAFLHDHAHAKGWAWRTQEITDGFATTAALEREYVDQAIGAFALGHAVADPREAGTDRPLALVSGRIGADGRGVIRWQGVIPVGFVGAPVIAVRELDGLAFGMHCVGLLLPGDRLNAVAPFSTIRALIDDIVRSDETLPKRPVTVWNRLRRTPKSS
jgi:hypothetical protein